MSDKIRYSGPLAKRGFRQSLAGVAIPRVFPNRSAAITVWVYKTDYLAAIFCTSSNPMRSNDELMSVVARRRELRRFAALMPGVFAFGQVIVGSRQG